MGHHRCNHPTKQCSTQNQVHSNGVNNDNISQHVNVINQKHNVDLMT